MTRQPPKYHRLTPFLRFRGWVTGKRNNAPWRAEMRARK
jgi:hypothetical protein